MTRKEAIAFFRDMNECTYGNVEPIQVAIKALEQEPNTGYWIQVDDIANAFDCSECDAMVSREYNYCPKCGCRMEGEIE